MAAEAHSNAAGKHLDNTISTATYYSYCYFWVAKFETALNDTTDEEVKLSN